MTTKSYLPLFYVFLSGLGFSIQGAAIKRLSEAGFDASFAIIFLRGCIQGSLAFLALGVLKKGWFRESASDSNENKDRDETSWLELIFGSDSREAFVLVLRGAFGLLSIALGFIAIEMMPLGDTMAVVMTAPTYSYVLSLARHRRLW